MNRVLVTIALICLMASTPIYSEEDGIPHPPEPETVASSTDCRLDFTVFGWHGEDNPRIYVSGSIEVYKQGTEVNLYKIASQGINPAILMLDLKVAPGQGSAKTYQHPFQYDDSGPHVSEYKTVQVTLNGDLPCSVEIH